MAGKTGGRRAALVRIFKLRHYLAAPSVLNVGSAEGPATCTEVGALPAAKTIGVAMWVNGYVHGKAGTAPPCRRQGPRLQDRSDKALTNPGGP